MPDFKKSMRRGDKEIKDLSLIHSILEKASVLRLGLCYGDMPYIVPLNFVFDKTAFYNGTIYLHSALEGLKIDILRKNRKICFEVEDDLELLMSSSPCNWGMRYLSVIGHGEASLENDMDEKIKAFDLFMDKYSPRTQKEVNKDDNASYDYDKDLMGSTCLMGKKSGYINSLN
jgi:nitroimidazol reductase NimA-like FMN-containing flavoprotein (pyridoxamine 5'-phosphate oxidase superfamily)